MPISPTPRNNDEHGGTKAGGGGYQMTLEI